MLARDETPCLIFISHYPILVCSIGNVSFITPYEHGKSARNEISYLLKFSYNFLEFHSKKSQFKWMG